MIGVIDLIFGFYHIHVLGLPVAQVAGFHSFVGLAAVFAGFASYFNPMSGYTVMKALETSPLRSGF